MRFYTGQHAFYCGIDLHARVMYLCVMDQGGKILLHKNLPADPDAFLKAIAPYRADVVVAVECIFTWYWIADLCGREGIPFVLGHALYMKAIHGGKTKNDKIDSQKIALASARRDATHGLHLPPGHALHPGPAAPTDVPGASTLPSFWPISRTPTPSTTARHSERRSPTGATAWGSRRFSPIRWCEKALRWMCSSSIPTTR